MLSEHEQNINKEKEHIVLIKKIAKRYGITYEMLSAKAGIPNKTLQKITSYDTRYYGTEMNEMRIKSLVQSLIDLLNEKAELIHSDKEILYTLQSSLFTEGVDSSSKN